jgi:PST family polysaccharide transporter
VPGEPAPSLTRLAVGGVLWQGLASVLGKGFTVLATVVLARLLTPTEYGLVGLALVFITFAEYVSDLGVSQGLVYYERDHANEGGALLLSIGSGVALCLIGVLAAPAIARFFHEPAVAPMVRVLSLSLLVGAVRQVPDALLRRELDFRGRMMTEVARAVTQGVVSIVLALAGLGAWAIVWGYLAGSVAWCASAWIVVDYRPRRAALRLGSSTARRLLGYGAPAAAQGILAALIFDVDYVIVGNVLGATALGGYTLAFRLPQLVIINVFFVLSSVAFPVFSRARGEPSQLRRGYVTSIRLQSAYGAAVGVALFVLAPLVVPVLFGAKWDASIVPMQWLALYAVARSLGSGAVDVYKGIGRPGIAAAVSLLRLAVLVPALLIAAPHGIDEVAWTQAALALVFAILMQAVACRVIGLSVPALGAALRPAAAVAVGTAAGAALARWGLGGPAAVHLAVAATAAAIGGLAALRLADAPFLREVRALLQNARGIPVAQP